VENLFESELFGHVKGSFTGAVVDKTGLVEVAHTGTLFLDEISEMSPQLQVKLLRLLEEKEFKPVGSAQTRKVDVRFITATNRVLEEESRTGRFRSDLFYRLNVVPIFLPSLKERPEDIWPLFLHFAEVFQAQMGKHGIQISKRMRTALEQYDWPGNVRELINVAERTVTLADSGSVADITQISRRPARAPWTATSQGGTLKEVLDGVEKSLVTEVLLRSHGNRSEAARRLGISRQALLDKIKKHGLRIRRPSDPDTK